MTWAISEAYKNTDQVRIVVVSDEVMPEDQPQPTKDFIYTYPSYEGQTKAQFKTMVKKAIDAHVVALNHADQSLGTGKIAITGTIEPDYNSGTNQRVAPLALNLDDILYPRRVTCRTQHRQHQQN